MNVQDILSKIKQYPIPVGGLIIALVLVGVFMSRKGIYPVLDSEVKALETQLSIFNKNERNALNLSNDVARAKELLEDVRGRLMDRRDVASNQGYFYDLERISGVSIVDDIREKSERYCTSLPEPKNFDVIRFSIKVDGRFNEIMEFVNLLESGTHLSYVESFVMSSGQAGEIIRLELDLAILGGKDGA